MIQHRMAQWPRQASHCGEVMMMHRFDCVHNHFWRNSVVIAFETLSSFLT